MTEIRKLYGNDLRKLCIRKEWYTRGGNEDYSKMLRAADEFENVTTETIVSIAEDILQHSDTDHPLTSICFEVAKICNSFFE